MMLFSKELKDLQEEIDKHLHKDLHVSDCYWCGDQQYLAIRVKNSDNSWSDLTRRVGLGALNKELGALFAIGPNLHWERYNGR